MSSSSSRNQEPAESVSNRNAKWIYDAYLSFCGNDTGKSFASDLNTALLNAGVVVFRENNDELRSEEQTPQYSVLDAIEGSRISIIVFSRNYADSGSRLQGLQKIMECHRIKGQIVVPVFYDVYPFDVGNQTGIFGEAFELRCIAPNILKENWRLKLREASNIPGFTVLDPRNESKVIKEAVGHVTNLLDMQQQKDLFVAKHPVGLESRVQKVIQLLSNSQQTKDDVILLGIWGMGGVGKTTLAKAIYNTIGPNFEAKSFLQIRRTEDDRFMISFQKRLLSDICKIREVEIESITIEELMKRSLGQKRILLVIDDVWDMGELSGWLESRQWFGQESRIIITCRNEELLRKLGVDQIYNMKQMNKNESLELLSWHAFKQEHPPEDNYAHLSRKIVFYSGRLPLILEVLGSFLSQKIETLEWETVLLKLQGNVQTDDELHVLRICYDKLAPQMQSMFLEIASFYFGMSRNNVIHELNSSGYSAELGITLLEANSLIKIDEDNLIRMHDTLQDMGRAIIQSESRRRPEMPKEYEVFLSFRGEDTRASFVSHLHASLQNAGLHVFKDDDEIPRGERISVSLLRAIGNSRIAIVVLSRNYANSRWCMTELECIMEHCRTMNLVVVPVFYQVDPSEVRNQRGEFGKAFNDLIKRISADKEESWKRELLEVGGRAGFVVVNTKNESEDIRKVVENVTDLLGKTDLFVAEHPVGIDSRVKDVVQLFDWQESNNVQLLGIWGMGGIGKTTIAKAIYNQVRGNFEAKSFLFNVRELWEENNGQVSLQQRLLSDVYKTTKIKIETVDSGKMELKERLRQKRIFLVLDDVNELEQLNALCGSRDWFGKGSRIIITTRNADVLHKFKVDDVYPMEEMDEKESLELFSWHAFKQPIPSEGFAELSSDLVDYCGRLPLALQVIGSFLLTRVKREWKSVLEKLKVIPNDEVLTKLRISFDGLSDDDVKEIFLDIAFFFIGMDRDDVIEILSDCGHFPEIGISVLVQQSLVTVDNKNKIGMHDLLRDMGRAIVRKKSKVEGQELSRLWRYQDLHDELSKDTTMTALKGLTLKLATKDTPTRMKTKDFEKMKNLRLLELAGIKLDGDYEYLSRDIRWLCWHGFPSRYTPADFHHGSLVAIELKYSEHLERVWKKSQMLKKLKFLNLSHSPNLIQTPDFSKLPNLEKLIVKDCPNLSSISQTIGDLSKILLINLKDCTNLQSLPKSIYELKSLKTLILSGCSKIEKLEEDLEQMESLTTLIADKTGVTKVPFAVVRSKSIAYISLCGYEGFSRDVFPHIVRSWMSPANRVSSLVKTSATLSSLGFLDDLQDSCFHGLSSIIKHLPKLQTIWVKCESKVQLHQNVERILNTLNTNREELEAMASTSSTFSGQVCKTSSNNLVTSLLIQMGMNCHITSTLREIILQKLPATGPGLLPKNNPPEWLTFNGKGSSVSFDVPKVDGYDLKTIMCIVYFSSPDNITSEGLQNMLVINYTNPSIQLYKRDGLASLEEEDQWQKVVSNIEPGDKLNITVIFGSGFIVKKTSVYFVYDEPTDEKKHCPKRNKNVIASGGDETTVSITGRNKANSGVHEEIDGDSSSEDIAENERVTCSGNHKIQVKECKSKKELRTLQMGDAIAARADASEGKAESYMGGSKEATSSHVTADYSITKCMNLLNEIEGISDDIYVKAMEKFKEPEYREMFVAAPLNRKLAWLNKI